MYEYFIGCIILAFVWTILFIPRKDLRKPMIWSGLAYIVIITIIFLIFKLFFFLGIIKATIIPGYWNPNTLFNLGRITGGYAIEDVLFMFFVGGVATFIYEYVFKKKIELKKTYKQHITAPIIGIISGILVSIIFKSNLIYSLITFGFVGAISIWIERKDLIKHSLFGGLVFLLIYFIAFFVFNTIFPDFISQVYNLRDLSGILIFSVPLEEILYAISFGLMWAPIYEYEHGKKDVDM